MVQPPIKIVVTEGSGDKTYTSIRNGKPVTVTRKSTKPTYSLEKDLDGSWTANQIIEYAKETLINTAVTVLDDEQKRGFDKEPVMKIDGKFGRSIESVNPFGEIEFTSRANIADILILAYTMILEKSRVATGRYLKSNVVTYNDKIVTNTMEGLKTWLEKKKDFKQGDQIRFVNFAPYANKLELEGLSAGRVAKKMRAVTDRKGRETKKMVRKPNGTYALSYTLLRRKFKNNSLIKYEPVLGSKYGLLNPARGSGVGRIRQTGRSAGRPYVYPSILIYVIESGIKQ